MMKSMLVSSLAPDNAEWQNRTLKEMMKSMLVSSLALDNLWGEAILSTCHTQNRIPYKETEKRKKNKKKNLMNCGKVLHLV